MVDTARHSKVARLSAINGQPPWPRLKVTLANLSSRRVAKWRASASCSAPRMLTVKKPERAKPEKDEALRLRLHSTRGGSRETAAKELAVRPTRSASGVQVATTATPVAKRPSAWRRPALSSTSPLQETIWCVMPNELHCASLPPCREDRGLLAYPNTLSASIRQNNMFWQRRLQFRMAAANAWQPARPHLVRRGLRGALVHRRRRTRTGNPIRRFTAYSQAGRHTRRTPVHAQQGPGAADAGGRCALSQVDRHSASLRCRQEGGAELRQGSRGPAGGGPHADHDALGSGPGAGALRRRQSQRQHQRHRSL